MPTKSDDFYKKVDIVDAPFPYQIPQDDSEEEKYRPVLILAPAQVKGGFVCAYITSKSHRLGVIPIFAKDFKEGTLSYDPSYIQPSTVYTVDAGLIRRKYGTLKDDKVEEVIKALVEILQKPPEISPTAKAWERPKKNF